jgi:hypothetical protein
MSADSPDDPAALARLARTVLGTLFDEPPILAAGRVPDGWPSSLIPPPPVSTLGGFSAGTSMTAVFLYPPTADRPLAEYRALLEDNGWTLPRGGFAEGFESTVAAMLCRESSLANLRRAKSDPADKSIVVSLSVCDGWPCREDARMPHHSTIPVPRLVTLPGVRWDTGGGSSGGGDHTTRHIRVTTDLSPAELLPLYARQLADAGWKTGTVHATRANAIQWLEATEPGGRVWRGLLVVYVNGSTREVFIYMAAVRPQRSHAVE